MYFKELTNIYFHTPEAAGKSLKEEKQHFTFVKDHIF